MSTTNLKIKVTSTDGTRVVEITKPSATIGSAAHCDVRLEHASIDPEHARAWREGGRLWVQDLGSTAGTFLNGNRLPAMKPMLVRDLDGLKLGEAQELLGFDKAVAEPIRAPRVTAPPTPPPAPVAVSFEEHTLTDIRPFVPVNTPAEDSRQRDERARVGRDLAELRLQLQMAQLEKTSATELRAEVNGLRADLSRLEDERREFKATLIKNRELEATRQAQVEEAVAEQRARANREVAELRDQQNEHFERLKTDLVNEATRQMRGWLSERGLPRDVAQALETELGTVLRAATDPHAQKPAAPANVTDITRSRLKIPAQPAVVAAAVAEAAPRRRTGSAQKTILIGATFAMIGTGLGLYSLRARNGGGGDSRAPASTWHPHQDRVAKATHADNVIYTEGYLELMRGSAWRKARGAELAKPPWNFDAPTIKALLDREATLVRDLAVIHDRARQGREQEAVTEMHSRESEYVRGLLTSFSADQVTYDRFVASGVITLQRLLPR